MQALTGGAAQQTCEKCGATASVADDPMAECPSCGAIYSRVREHREKLAAKASADATAKAEAETRREAQRAHYAAAGAAKLEQAKADRAMRGDVCTACGQTDAAVTRVRGSMGMELGLWVTGLLTLVFVIGVPILIAAIIYSIWRMASRHKECRACRSEAIVPASSPRGREIIAHYHKT